MQAGKILKWESLNFKNVNLWLKNSGSLSNSVCEENLGFMTFDLKHIFFMLFDKSIAYTLAINNLNSNIYVDFL